MHLSVYAFKCKLFKKKSGYDKNLFLWQLYVMELMIIENDARRYVTKAIELERELSSIEIREKMKGTILINSKDYHFLRKNMCKIIS